MAEAVASVQQQQQGRQPFLWEGSYPPGVKWDSPIPERTLPQLLDQATQRFRDRPCVDFLDKKYTYGAITDLVDRFAKGLQEMGLQKGQKVGLFLPNTPYSVICYFGILKAGGVVVNFNPLYAEREICHMINDSEADWMISLDLKVTYDKLAKMFGQSRLKKIIVVPMAGILPFPKNLLFPFVKKKEIAAIPRDDRHVWFKQLVANDGRPRPVALDAVNDVAVLQYTGGTTGVPKGAMLTHQNITANTAQASYWFSAMAEPGNERMLGVLPLFHVFAMTCVMNLTIQNGGEMILLPRFELEQVLETIHKKKPTQFPAVPTIYTAINNYKDVEKYDLSSIKVCNSGGAPLPVEVKAQFEKLTGCALVEGYGLSESAPIATINPTHASRAGSIGLPVPGTDIRIVSLEDRRTEVPRGERGEICIIGPQVMKGYWKKDKETAETLDGGMLHTGDVGYLDEDGYIFIVDRIKDMILAGGYNVYPRNVEEAIYQHPQVAECIVLGVPDPYRGQTVKAYIKTRDGAVLTKDDIKKFLEDKLSPIEQPKLYEFRDELPKTMIGKLSRKALLDELEAEKKKAG
ncbi:MULTISPECIES: long-chain fatty acid--CoA ligase [unclassified Azospirillum]|uniref:long-chain-fatty-acid--CoA ligase n=1 Tax=unclassified Azospirillum TaxID=2630922 RepID=UPI000B742125|nr:MULTISPECIES: long-chain fatty acid--CoA ligase [unclassified Azospirillum]SNS80744.1 long-chain acyl-CoA synthetase [Azospirillum sp. RU38E]SNS97841.1 long-chain acyl-CoA synthetase [Azospirillum sp. RU37A]